MRCGNVRGLSACLTRTWVWGAVAPGWWDSVGVSDSCGWWFRWRGRLPLDTDQFGQSTVEWSTGVGVWGPVGSAEDSFVGWSGDMPVVTVDQPVMNPAEEYQIVEVGGSSYRPGDDVMDLEPPGVGTCRMLTLVTVAVFDETS